MDAIPLEVLTAFQTIAGGGLLILAVYIINYLINTSLSGNFMWDYKAV
jgi:hypothetical protein